jgi:hypothetical protein
MQHLMLAHEEKSNAIAKAPPGFIFPIYYNTYGVTKALQIRFKNSKTKKFIYFF